ncbi:hypothetical protein CEB3_c13940 [Peptococcaceae bacterium CEB3]|nr:hypothetical protein CEB3_c13940 [Peptococcaceae bacterium CEB3]
MLDIGGLVLLIISLVGAVKGRGLPIWIPQILALGALVLLIYQAAWKKSRFAPIHTAAVWMTFVWIAGHALQRAWGSGVLTAAPLWLLILLTPLVAVAHQRAHKRFSPTAGKKLELTRTETTSLRDRWLSRRKNKNRVEKTKGIELIEFDLGEKINFQNK